MGSLSKRMKGLFGEALGKSGRPGYDGSTGKYSRKGKRGHRFEGSSQYTGMQAGIPVTPNTPAPGSAPKGPRDLTRKRNTGPAKTLLGG